MHYDGFLRGRIEHPIIIDKQTGNGIEVNKNMSSLDIKKLNQMYPCNTTDPVCGKFLYEFRVNQSDFFLLIIKGSVVLVSKNLSK